jgi:hypothetical protein
MAEHGGDRALPNMAAGIDSHGSGVLEDGDGDQALDHREL